MIDSTPSSGPIFEVYPAKSDCIGILSIPHSGLWIPDEFKGYLCENELHQNQDVDFEVHQLVNIDELNQQGILVFKSNVHRICCDLNRSPETAILNWINNSHGEQIVIKEIDSDFREKLTAKYHLPYFSTIDSAIDNLPTKVNLIDLHSMPSHPTDYHLAKNPDQAKTRPEFCLSDQFGKSCSEEFMKSCVELFSKHGFEAKVNEPYVGGHITQYFMDRPFHNIQIEIRRNLYMNESSFELKEITEFREKLTNILIEQFKRFYNRP